MVVLAMAVSARTAQEDIVTPIASVQVGLAMDPFVVRIPKDAVIPTENVMAELVIRINVLGVEVAAATQTENVLVVFATAVYVALVLMGAVTPIANATEGLVMLASVATVLVAVVTPTASAQGAHVIQENVLTTRRYSMNRHLFLSMIFALVSVSAFATEKTLVINEVLYTSPLGILGQNTGAAVQSTAAELCGGDDKLLSVRDLEVVIYSPKGEIVNGLMQVTYPKLKITGLAICK